MPKDIKIDVSVIISTYNRLWSLPRAIDSCRNSLCNTEIIVVDDGSVDGTWAWLQEQKDVRSFYQSNQGQTYAVNYGTGRARGKYIRFLDSDDFLCPGIIDKQFGKAEETSADLVYSKVNFYDHKTGAIVEHPDLEPWDDFIEVQLSNRYGSHYLGMLFKTDWIKKTPRRPEFSFRDDRMLLLEYGLLDPKIELVSGCAGYWVQHKSQMQANYNGLQSQVTNWQHLTLLKQILDNLEATGRLTERRKKAVCTVLWPLAHWVAIDFLSEAIKIVDWIFKLDPDFKIPAKKPLSGMYKRLGFKRTELLLKVRRNLMHVFR